MIRLTVRHQTQPEGEEVLDFDKDVVTIGRHSENDVVLAERTVSRKHAQIEKEGERYLVRDLESHFGVFVNKRKVVVEEIAPGAEIYITPFILRFDKVEAPEAAAGEEFSQDIDVTLGPAIEGGESGFQPGPAAPPPIEPPPEPELPPAPPAEPEPAPPPPPPAPPAPEPAPPPEPALPPEPPPPPAPEEEHAPVYESAPQPAEPADHLDDLPGLESSEQPPAPDAGFAPGEPLPPEGEDETLMKWDGGGEEEPPAGPEPEAEDAPPPFEVDEGPAPPPPPPQPAPPPPAPAGEEESSGFQPWDRAVTDEEDEEEDILEEVDTRHGAEEPMSPQGKKRLAQLRASRGYGRIRGVLLGFLLLLLPFFPVAASNGKVTFFWDFFDEGITAFPVFPLLGGGVLGLLVILASIFGSGGIRGFLQLLFSGAFLGVLLGVTFEGVLSMQGTAEGVNVFKLFQNNLLIPMIAGGFLFAVLGARLKIYHPRKLTPRLFALLGAGAVIAAVLLPPATVGAPEGPSMFKLFTEALNAPEIPIFFVVNLGLLGLIALICVTNLLGFRSGLRSRLALMCGFYLLLYPLIDMISMAVDAGRDIEVIDFVSMGRFYLIGFLALWIFLIGAASFIGNFLVAVNYNEKMLLAGK